MSANSTAFRLNVYGLEIRSLVTAVWYQFIFWMIGFICFLSTVISILNQKPNHTWQVSVFTKYLVYMHVKKHLWKLFLSQMLIMYGHFTLHYLCRFRELILLEWNETVFVKYIQKWFALTHKAILIKRWNQFFELYTNE